MEFEAVLRANNLAGSGGPRPGGEIPTGVKTSTCFIAYGRLPPALRGTSAFVCQIAVSEKVGVTFGGVVLAVGSSAGCACEEGSVSGRLTVLVSETHANVQV